MKWIDRKTGVLCRKFSDFSNIFTWAWRRSGGSGGWAGCWGCGLLLAGLLASHWPGVSPSHWSRGWRRGQGQARAAAAAESAAGGAGTCRVWEKCTVQMVCRPIQYRCTELAISVQYRFTELVISEQYSIQNQTSHYRTGFLSPGQRGGG